MPTKKSNKTKTKKRVNKNKQKKEIETLKEDYIPNEIMDKEDREAEIVLNDLVPEDEKDEFGINENTNKKPRKGSLKLNFNLFPKAKKSTKQVRRLKEDKVIKTEPVENTKQEVEQSSSNEEEL
ncbi:hypothetical protein [Paraclostridium sordellii]|uniref:hypothetical protein n=1 Tax=Paraclostridium sordellii TaxID=1505 RepID=UPI00189B3CD9|nr:hypothetical protein [Paeniclostridium sordellii]